MNNKRDFFKKDEYFIMNLGGLQLLYSPSRLFKYKQTK